MSIVFVPGGRAQNRAKLGTLDKIEVHGKALEGNLEGDSPDRDVFVYIPASYAPVQTAAIRWCTFFTVTAHMPGRNSLSVASAADAAGSEIILVLPDAFTVYDGSMFSNSPITGDWETFIANDLVAYIDGHYRTIADRSDRGRLDIPWAGIEPSASE